MTNLRFLPAYPVIAQASAQIVDAADWIVIDLKYFLF